MTVTKFEEMNLSRDIMRAIERQGFKEATTIQAETIPAMMEWRDVMAKAPTGTGKTLAFAIPMLEHIDLSDEGVQALVLSPTRELALQICDEIRKLAAFMPRVKVLAVYGGQNIELQMRGLKGRPQIIVATPGRLIDHLNRRTIRLSSVKTVVLDEADRMLDMGFVKEVTRILDLTTARRQLALMSATLSREVMDIAWVYQRDAVELEVAPVAEDMPQILQYTVEAAGNKMNDILTIIENEGYERSMIFCNTKHAVRRLTQNLARRGCPADCIHGDVKQSSREKVMAAFRAGTFGILVATDVAARGLDISGVDAVFNYDIPLENEYYIHRIGRTGRAKKHGVSYTFVSYFETGRIKEIARYTKSPMIPMHFDKERKLVPAHGETVRQAI